MRNYFFTAFASFVGILILLVVSGTGTAQESKFTFTPTANERKEINWFIQKHDPEYETNVKATDKEGYTLLHHAAMWNVCVAKYLVSKGADVNVSFINPITPSNFKLSILILTLIFIYFYCIN